MYPPHPCQQMVHDGDLKRGEIQMGWDWALKLC